MPVPGAADPAAFCLLERRSVSPTEDCDAVVASAAAPMASGMKGSLPASANGQRSRSPMPVEIKILRQVRAESSRRPPRHRCDA